MLLGLRTGLPPNMYTAKESVLMKTHLAVAVLW